jgi:hypothetical protein
VAAPSDPTAAIQLATATNPSGADSPYFVHIERVSGAGVYLLALRLIVADLEAESGTLVAPFMVVSDPTASGGAYVMDGNLPGITGDGSLTLAFSTPPAGDGADTFVRGRTRALNGSSDSFFVTIDSVPTQTWSTSACSFSPDWGMVYVSALVGGTVCSEVSFEPIPFQLAPGPHTLTLTSREGQSQIDRIWIQEWPADAGSVAARTLTIAYGCSHGPQGPDLIVAAALWLTPWSKARRRRRSLETESDTNARLGSGADHLPVDR